MNNPLSDGNESIIDIFVLGRSETGTQQLKEQLEHQDYRVTLFNDGTDLIDTLHSGKPNLIICDTISFGQEAYDCCRLIKSDEYLWMIPVMILTRASTLSDLLYVLDSNGDNFIAQPYDSPYLLSQIEVLLQTPVEQPSTDLIKTQFKIQHDDQIFVVTADRRKLLEFLLSAFEIAVKNSEDLSSANTEIQILSSRLTTLEDAGIENARLIEMLSASVKKKEQDERTLKIDFDEIEQAHDEKTAEIGHLSQELGETKKLLTTAEEHIRILLEEREKTTQSFQSENSDLAEQVSSLSQKINAKTRELEEKTKESDVKALALDEETTRSARLELAVKESDVQIGQLKTSLQILTVEKEQLASQLSSEKNRARVAEEGIQSVLQAKALSENDLTRLVNEQKDAARQQNDEILRLKTEIEAESGRCTSTEKQLENIRHELEQLITTHDADEMSKRQQFDDLQTRFDSAVATMFSQERELKILKDELVVAHANNKKSAASTASVTAAFNETRLEIEEREWKVQSLEKQIADAGILNEKSNEKVRNLTASLESLQSALNAEKEQHAAAEKRLNEAIRERDENLQSVRGAHENVKTDLDQHKNDLLRLNRDLEAALLLRSTLQGDITTASSKIKELEHELKSALQVKDQNGEQVRSLAEELGMTKSALKEARASLDGEKEQHAAAEKQLNEAIRERDKNLQSVRGAHETVKTDLDQHKNDLSRLNRDLEAATLIRSTLQGDITAASSKIKELEHELKSAVQVKDQNGEQARSLAEELEKMKSALKEARAALDGEKEQRAAAEAQLNAAIRVRDDNLQSVRGAHDQTKSDLDVHRNDLMRLNRDLEAATHLTSVLLADFNAASVRIDQLEHDLNSVVQGKEQTGQQARSLSDDLERTKAELETERRIRRTAEVNLQKSAQVSSKLEGDIARSAAEREGLKAALERERLLHTATAEKARAAAHAKEHVELEFKTVKEDHERHDDLRAAKIKKLNQDFEQVLARQRDLEQKVKTLESDKAAAEARAEALANEIEQARTALADEWEDHMNDEERLAATEKKATQMAQSLSGIEKPSSERERKWAVVVKQTDLPAEIRPTPKAVIATKLPETHAVVIPDKKQESAMSPGIEDLFEDETPTAPVEQIPVSVHSHATPAAETPVVINEEEPDEGHKTTEEPESADQEAGELEASEQGDEQEAGEDADEEEEPEDDEEADTGEQVKTLNDFGPPSGYGISFNRQQWFDLLKWSHHSGALSQEQRMQIVRMGRLIQNGRKLTQKQDEQVREMTVLVQTLGYRFH